MLAPTLTCAATALTTDDIAGGNVAAGTSLEPEDTKMDKRTVNKLMQEAWDASDFRMVSICADALDGDEDAIAEVARVIGEAKEDAR